MFFGKEFQIFNVFGKNERSNLSPLYLKQEEKGLEPGEVVDNREEGP